MAASSEAPGAQHAYCRASHWPTTLDSILNSPILILMVRYPPPGDPESRKTRLQTHQGLKDSQAPTTQSIQCPLGHRSYHESRQGTQYGHAIQAPGQVALLLPLEAGSAAEP